jgi:hypothetical protein
VRSLCATMLLLACSGNFSAVTQPNPATAGNNPSVPGEGPVGSEPPEEIPPFAPAPAVMQRLTATQYRNAVKDVFSLPSIPEIDLPPDGLATFASVGASQVVTNTDHTRRYAVAARQIVAAALEAKNILSACKPTKNSDACIDDVMRRNATLLWRRPVSASELTAYRDIVTAVGTSPEALQKGLHRATAALLESPEFLYQPYFGQDANGGFRRLTDLELASRLSLFLWNSIPDEALLAAAKAGQLSTEEGYLAQVRRMLDNGRAKEVAGRILAEGWGIDQLTELSRDGSKYPNWTAGMVSSMKKEFQLLLEETEKDGFDFREVMALKHTFVDANLAPLYGKQTASNAFEKMALDDGRQGLLGTSVMLTASNTHDESSAPIFRGLFVLTKLLCLSFGSPPQDVLERIAMMEAGQSARSNFERVEERKKIGLCWGCHQSMDPTGLSMENYDGVGRFRTSYGPYSVNNQGSFEGSPASTPGALASVLKEDPRFTRCAASTLYTSATAHLPLASEAAAVASAHQAFASNNFQLNDLLIGVVTSEGFKTLAANQ